MDAFIVGAGASGFLHALALRSAGVRIAAVYDPHLERAEWLAGLTRARAVRSLADDSGADVVAICSPPAMHAAQAEALARPGRITFVEKPVALDIAELERLALLRGVVPIVQWRAGRSAVALRAAFASRAFGDAPRITCDLHLRREDDYWRTRDARAWPCGALQSIGIHAVDLVLWSVAREAERTALRDDRTSGELGLRFDDGTTALVRITLDASGGVDRFRLRVRGSHASAELHATENDPTAVPLRWLGRAPPSFPESGAAGSPLLVPYLHEVLRGERHVGVRDVAAAHVMVSRDSASDRPTATPTAGSSTPPGTSPWSPSSPGR